jgi:UDPglucose 6-dehydrogenase
MSNPVNICVIGSGYVGLVAAVCFAETGHQVICVDNDLAKVASLSRGEVPIYERHLPELLARHLNKGVSFTSDLKVAVEQSEAIFIAVGTPQSSTGSADLSFVEAVVSEIARSINGYKVSWKKAPFRSTPTLGFIASWPATAWKNPSSMSSPTQNSSVKAPPSSTSFTRIAS